jgi:hypothetical protein
MIFHFANRQADPDFHVSEIAIFTLTFEKPL